ASPIGVAEPSPVGKPFNAAMRNPPQGRATKLPRRGTMRRAPSCSAAEESFMRLYASKKNYTSSVACNAAANGSRKRHTRTPAHWFGSKLVAVCHECLCQNVTEYRWHQASCALPLHVFCALRSAAYNHG